MIRQIKMETMETNNRKIKQILNRLVIALFFGGILLQSCNDDDDPIVEEKLFFDALGDINSIESIQSISWESTGQAFEFQQDGELVQDFVADFSYKLRASSDIASWEQAWNIDADYFFESSLEFTETVVNNLGKSEGINGFLAKYFSPLGIPPYPMFSTRLAARRKSLVMSSPLTLANLVLSNNPDLKFDDTIISVGFNTSPLGFGANTPDIQLEVNEAGFPLRAFTTENDPLYGDVTYEVFYDTWIKVGEVNLPTALTHVLNGQTIRKEMLRNIQFNQDITDVIINEGEAYPYDINEGQKGYLSSQFHFRMQMITVPIDFPTTFTEANTPLVLAATGTLDTDPNAFVVGGDLQLHYTFAFDIGNSVVIYDTPYNNERSGVVLDRVTEQFGSKPISQVIVSHNHFDHSGGVRGALANGGALIVGGSSFAEDFKQILLRDHQVVDNPLTNPAGVNVVSVEDFLILGEDNHQIEIHVFDNLHAPHGNHLVVYKPSTKSLFLNDLFNPGFQLLIDNFTPSGQQIMKERAKDVMDFIIEKGLDVDFVYGTHGFTSREAASIEALEALAN